MEFMLVVLAPVQVAIQLVVAAVAVDSRVNGNSDSLKS